jgi:hypothetical protein
VFLEQRVPEELATEGTSLSRLGVALDVELVGDRMVVSLVDLATHRAAASTKIDSVPADREAAVASVTQVAANLAAQLSSKPSSEANAMAAALAEDRKARQARADAEERFRQQEITFGDEYKVVVGNNFASVHRKWVAYVGDQRLDGAEFYRHVHRDDLASSYEHRRTGGYAGIGISIGLMGLAAYLIVGPGLPNHESGTCDFGSPSYDTCQAKVDARNDQLDSNAKTYMTAGLAVTVASGVSMAVGFYYLRNADPVSESEAHDLASEHNRAIRIQEGLTTASRTTRLRNVVITPYAGGDGGGLAVAGRF